jgi:hypothetical protein
MLKKFQSLAKSLFSSPNYTPVERWALRNCNRATPDGLIASAIVESFAKDFKDWDGDISNVSTKIGKVCCSEGDPRVSAASAKLTNHKKKIVISAGWVRGKSRDNDGLNPWYFHSDGLTVNGESLEEQAADYIVSNWRTIKQRVEAANAAAEKAKRDMERNEKKWNLAEDLLGMKRNEFGALVPKVSVEETV